MTDRKPGQAGPEGDRKAWSGRFQKSAAADLEAFSSSVHFDVRMAAQDVRGSIAHARMLGRQGIVGAEDVETLVAGLEQIGREIESGDFELDPAAEDVHMNVERRLFEIAGPVAGRLHTGRSRNDQVATDFALWMRDTIPDVRRALLELRSALVERAANEIDVVLPGYTHLQRAQPVRLGHHWLAHFEVLGRDDGRLADARKRLGGSPLGAGALAGSTLPVDRASTAEALGFAAPARNSLDAVASRDGAVELLSALALQMVHLSRLAEELVLWSSSEFGFIQMDDAYATGSSLMPQKKNPDVPELVRGRSGRVIGDLVSLLVTLKGLPLTYNRDLQEDKEPVFDAVDTTRSCARILASVVRTLRVDADAMGRAADDAMLLATDLAEFLVEQDVPFREAHEVVGRTVALAVERGVSLRQLARAELRELHPALDIDIDSLLSVERSLEARGLDGGPSRKNVQGAVARARDELAATASEIAETEPS
jgi:argininosuccinate lyase